MRLSEKAKLDVVQLIRSENVGPITFHKLLERYGSAGNALDHLPELAGRGGKRQYKICPRATAKQEVDRAGEIGAKLICHGEEDYPRLLAEIDDAPPLIYCLGNMELLKKPAIAIVGARNASANGTMMARKLAFDLASKQSETQSGLLIVSGFARGIDAAAHQGALQAASEFGSSTLAVMAGGVNFIYPAEHKDLHETIQKLGVIISEQPPDLEPQARHFPRRNRLISGLSLGVVVVEAALKSGSLITAKMAADQGRDVFAVPGSPLDGRSKGGNELIRQGAILTEQAEDIYEHLNLSHGAFSDLFSYAAAPKEDRVDPPQSPSPAPTPAFDKDKILTLLGHHPTEIDVLIRQLNVPAQYVVGALLELEIAGKVERLPGNRVVLLSEF